VDGIRAICLSKTYQSDFGNKSVQALKRVSFSIGKGELLGVMGHNGAGKTTLINVLCGLVYKDEGNGRIFDFSIEQQLNSIRKRIGVVSQFDVLWDQLTGVEHMQLFQILKRVDVANFEQLMEQRLKDVGLNDAGNQQVGKYSGGMRRRISVALSTMGNPNVILMDEPSTGMDPVSRRHVWSLIQRLKLEKAIVMTTHAMEEAELLSDKIIVLDHGEVKCVGTPLQLKNMIGKGYRISMICEKQDVARVKSLMQTVLPHGHFQEQSGGSGGMVYDLPISHVKELGSIFKLMDGKKGTGRGRTGEGREAAIEQLSELVTDVGVSQTTLEEVFMHVTGGEGQLSGEALAAKKVK
jgi:ABC-type multidrug transport system ATPase subunit